MQRQGAENGIMQRHHVDGYPGACMTNVPPAQPATQATCERICGDPEKLEMQMEEERRGGGWRSVSQPSAPAITGMAYCQRGRLRRGQGFFLVVGCLMLLKPHCHSLPLANHADSRTNHATHTRVLKNLSTLSSYHQMASAVQLVDLTSMDLRSHQRHVLWAGGRRKGVELDLCDCGAWLCDNGFFMHLDEVSGCSVCKPCPVECDRGFWMSGLCTPAASGCSPCASCPRDHYIRGACGAKKQTVCQECTRCILGTYVQSQCGVDSDTVCAACPNALQPFTHYTGDFNGTACEWQCDASLKLDNATGLCSCEPNEFYSSEDSTKFDVALQVYLPKGCIPCRTCAPGRYVVEGDECSTVSDRKCSPCPNSLPPLGTWTGTYDVEKEMCDYTCPATYSRDKEEDQCICAAGFYTTDDGATCRKCTKCADTEYTKIFCSATADSVCETCYSKKPANSEYTSYNCETPPPP